MVFNMPQGNSTVQFNVKSKTPGFFPILYVSVFNHKESNVVFPPHEFMGSYQTFNSWDQDLYLMKVAII
jgi:hypothetical protein